VEIFRKLIAVIAILLNTRGYMTMRQQVPPKRRYLFPRLHGVTSKNTITTVLTTVKVKVKLLQCLIKNHAMKTFWEVEE
jgi:hypothetical protein